MGPSNNNHSTTTNGNLVRRGSNGNGNNGNNNANNNNGNGSPRTPPRSPAPTRSIGMTGLVVRNAATNTTDETAATDITATQSISPIDLLQESTDVLTVFEENEHSQKSNTLHDHIENSYHHNNHHHNPIFSDEEESISLDGGSSTSNHNDKDNPSGHCLMYNSMNNDGSASSVSMDEATFNGDDDDDDIEYQIFTQERSDDTLMFNTNERTQHDEEEDDQSSMLPESSHNSSNTTATGNDTPAEAPEIPDTTPKETTQLQQRWRIFWKWIFMSSIMFWIALYFVITLSVSSSSSSSSNWIITVLSITGMHMIWMAIAIILPIQYYIQPMIQTRHMMVNLASSKSQAIVSSLFPSVVHDRLFQSTTQQQPTPTAGAADGIVDYSTIEDPNEGFEIPTTDVENTGGDDDIEAQLRSTTPEPLQPPSHAASPIKSPMSRNEADVIPSSSPSSPLPPPPPTNETTPDKSRAAYSSGELPPKKPPISPKRPPRSVAISHKKRLSAESDVSALIDDADHDINATTAAATADNDIPPRRNNSLELDAANSPKGNPKRTFKKRFSLLSSSSQHTTTRSSTSSRNLIDEDGFDGNGSFASMAEDIVEEIVQQQPRRPKSSKAILMSSTTARSSTASSAASSSKKDLPPWQRLRNFLDAAGTTPKSKSMALSTSSHHHHYSGSSNHHQMASMTGSSSMSFFNNEPPIADLFPNCTVLFADIAGFTAWSSTREPAQVFTLLETIYRAFDHAARKYVVFKVETIGDCYVAVTGLPEPQDDHAVRMVKFARECLLRLHDWTRQLEVRLGPETGDLGLRVGLHSGPVTAGVLRGDKSRFQLFGDSVNTAARMESTGQAGRIQLSPTTADLLERANKGHWKIPREETVDAKGIGELQTYWAVPRAIAARNSSSGNNNGLNVSNHSMQSMQSFRGRRSTISHHTSHHQGHYGVGSNHISNTNHSNNGSMTVPPKHTDEVKLVTKKRNRGALDSMHRRRASNDSAHRTYGRRGSGDISYSKGNNIPSGSSAGSVGTASSNASQLPPFSPPGSRQQLLMNSSMRGSMRSLASRQSMLNSISGDLWGAEDSSSNSNANDDVIQTADANRQERLIEWNIDLLTRLLKQICAHRQSQSAAERASSSASSSSSSSSSSSLEGNNQPRAGSATTPTAAAATATATTASGQAANALDEVTEIIDLSKPTASLGRQSSDEFHHAIDPDTVELDECVVDQLREFVTMVACMYRDNFFHNFEHASHVTMSAQKLLKRVVAAHESKTDHHTDNLDGASSSSNLKDYTYVITSDPLIQFAIVFSALIHDVDHTGVPNSQLVKEKAMIAQLYKNRCVAEQNSLDLAWEYLLNPTYKDLQRCIFANASEMARFRQVVVNVVMATDIFDPDMKAIRDSRWDKAFHNDSPLSVRDEQNLKATIVIEYIMQASDVSHTMQHWKIYQTWNERLFMEQYSAYRTGRAETNPADGWYKGELWFFDNYIIPLARKLKECRVFGAASDECLQYAEKNRKEWKSKGAEIVATYVKKYGDESGSGSSGKP